MKQIFLMLCILPVMALASVELAPVLQIDANATLKDLTLHGDTLVMATDAGKLKVYDYNKKEFTKTIALPNVKDFTGESVPARLFSADFMDGRYLILSDSGKGGYANLWLERDGNLTQLLSAKDKLAIIKARFITKDKILLGLLSDEAVLYDVASKKELYRTQLSPSKFSDFALNSDKSKAVFSCESGVLSLVDIKSGKVLQTLSGQNVDNVYKVDFKSGIVSAAGQDRRGALYDTISKRATYIQGSFLIYATALSPSAKEVAFSMDEQNNITIYDTASKVKIATLKGQKSTLNSIIFLDEKTLFSASDDSTVMMWRLP